MKLVFKAKKMPIGTVSHGRKKVAEGKWVPVPKDESGSDSEGLSDKMIETLRRKFSKIGAVDPDSPTYQKLTDMLDNMETADLKQLAEANIKFVSGLARNRVNRRKR